MNEKELLALKKEIEEKKMEISKLEGRKEHLLEQLQTDWQCKTIKEAKTKLSQLKKNKEKIQGNIDKALKKLTDEYDLDS